MITPGKVEEWIREVEQRPESAAALIREISLRLSELAEMNETLLAENIALQSGKKVAEYENRILNLEYQLEMLKRQVGDTATTLADSPELLTTLSLLIYTTQGYILRLIIDPKDLLNGIVIAKLPVKIDPVEDAPRLIMVDSQEELLFVFDSGRVRAIPAASMPPADSTYLDWNQAYNVEPRGGETLAAVLPIARMALYDYCLQASRKGYVKRLRSASMPTYVSSANIGAGVALPLDKTFELTFCDEWDRLVLVSRDGYLVSQYVNQLPYTIEEVFRLGLADHLISAFTIGEKSSIVAITNNGMVFQREIGWLEESAISTARGRAVLSKNRRDVGMYLVAAAAVDDSDWSVTLTTDGTLTIHTMSALLGAGILLDRSSELDVSGFTVFSN